jgi:hypothetical protein
LCPVLRVATRRAVAARAHTGEPRQAAALAEQLADALHKRGRWLGWPAAIYGEYLDATAGAAAARDFVTRFLRHTMSETIPPRRLEALMRKLGVDRDLAERDLDHAEPSIRVSVDKAS